MSTEAWLDYQVPGSPFFVLVDGRTGHMVGQGRGRATSASSPSSFAEPNTTASPDQSDRRRRRSSRIASTGQHAPRRPTTCCRRPASTRATPACTRTSLEDVFPFGGRHRVGRHTVGARPTSGDHRRARDHGAPARRLRGAHLRPPTARVGTTYPVAQFATFPLPDDIGDFGSGAVTLMGPQDVFASLFEYGPESVGTALFARQGRPARALARRLLAGQCCAGASPASRAPSGSSPRRDVRSPSTPSSGATHCATALVPRVNALIASLTVSQTTAGRPRLEAANGTDRPLPDRVGAAGRRRRRQGAPPRRHGPRPPRWLWPDRLARLAQRVARAVVRVGAIAEAAARRLRPCSAPPAHGGPGRVLRTSLFAVRRRATPESTEAGPVDVRVLRPSRHARHMAARRRSNVAPRRRGRDRRRSARRRDATLRTLLSHQPWAGLPLLFVSGVGLYLTYLALSPLATLEGARRLVRPRHRGGNQHVTFDLHPGRADGRLPREPAVASQHDQPVGLRRAVRSPSASGLDLALKPGTAYGADLRVRERRLRLRQHLLLGLLRVLLRRQRIQLLPRRTPSWAGGGWPTTPRTAAARGTTWTAMPPVHATPGAAVVPVLRAGL